jgi:uncharacterized MAPEG superfamily protein
VYCVTLALQLPSESGQISQTAKSQFGNAKPKTYMDRQYTLRDVHTHARHATKATQNHFICTFTFLTKKTEQKKLSKRLRTSLAKICTILSLCKFRDDNN